MGHSDRREPIITTVVMKNRRESIPLPPSTETHAINRAPNSILLSSPSKLPFTGTIQSYRTCTARIHSPNEFVPASIVVSCEWIHVGPRDHPFPYATPLAHVHAGVCY